MGYSGMGFVEAPANWASMTPLEKAMAQLRAPDAFQTAEGTMWGGQCAVDVWGFETCEIARAIVSPTSQKGSIYAAIASLIRYGQCWDSSELCKAAEAWVAKYRAGGALFPTGVLGPSAPVIIPAAAAEVTAAPVPRPAPGAPTCPVEYPLASFNTAGQLVCARAAGAESTPVPVPYGQVQVPAMVPTAAGPSPEGYAAEVMPPAEGSEWITGIPNWAVMAGGAVAALAAMSLFGGQK